MPSSCVCTHRSAAVADTFPTLFDTCAWPHTTRGRSWAHAQPRSPDFPRTQRRHGHGAPSAAASGPCGRRRTSTVGEAQGTGQTCHLDAVPTPIVGEFIRYALRPRCHCGNWLIAISTRAGFSCPPVSPNSSPAPGSTPRLAPCAATSNDPGSLAAPGLPHHRQEAPWPAALLPQPSDGSKAAGHKKDLGEDPRSAHHGQVQQTEAEQDGMEGRHARPDS